MQGQMQQGSNILNEELEQFALAPASLTLQRDNPSGPQLCLPGLGPFCHSLHLKITYLMELLTRREHEDDNWDEFKVYSLP